jgi:hypothetical protein
MERALGISYPTVRARVEALVQALGLADGEAVEIMVDEPAGMNEDLSAARREILERLAKGEIDAAGAAEALRGVDSHA